MDGRGAGPDHLIVVGVDGSGGGRRTCSAAYGHSRVWTTVLGSVAEECIRTATCPVVVIPAPHDTGTPPAPPAVP